MYDRYTPLPRHDLDYVVGVDLGQAQDYTAIAIVQRLPPALEGEGREVMGATYHLRHLERPDLGTRYPAIVDRCLGLLDSAPLSRETPMVVDRTGVGRAVVDMFAAKGLEPISVTIHGGDEVISEGKHHRVPKRELVGTLTALYQSGRLLVARTLPLAPVLTNELLNFKVKVDLRTAHDSYEAWRESVHDDLVLAVALACWYGEHELDKHQPMDERDARNLRGLMTGEFQPWNA
jgi:hypothetical protein